MRVSCEVFLPETRSLAGIRLVRSCIILSLVPFVFQFRILVLWKQLGKLREEPMAIFEEPVCVNIVEFVPVIRCLFFIVFWNIRIIRYVTKSNLEQERFSAPRADILVGQDLHNLGRFECFLVKVSEKHQTHLRFVDSSTLLSAASATLERAAASCSSVHSTLSLQDIRPVSHHRGWPGPSIKWIKLESVHENKLFDVY